MSRWYQTLDRGAQGQGIEQHVLDKLGLANRTHIATRARGGLRTEQPHRPRSRSTAPG
jgi:hypothetical protein